MEQRETTAAVVPARSGAGWRGLLIALAAIGAAGGTRRSWRYSAELADADPVQMHAYREA